VHPADIRASFLAYFERRGHRVVPSSSLVPADDPTLLFTNAGMNQFKDVFLGRETRDYTRAVSAQKCMRVSGKHNDLDNVGPSLRHHTFFEMLGNFSFGDYFKAEAIALAWELLTREWGLDPSRLAATVFKGEQGIPRDDEAYRIWRQFLPAERVGEMGMDDNFWAMGETGPCGRCSEIYYDRGPGIAGTGDFLTDIASGSERFVEIWNNVFMEFERRADGTLADLPSRSIDTGMGLERISAVLAGTFSNYDTELFQPILRALGQMTGREHRGTLDPADVSMRVVADHIRATTFLIADGVVPSNEWRGYVLRKIMRRAMRHGRRLGLVAPFLHELVSVVVAEMAGAYPELKANEQTVRRIVRTEEERFGLVLAEGLPRLEEVLEEAARGSRVVAGEQAFRLYDTYGVPRDFIEDLASAQGLAFDAAGFERALEEQREKARAKSAFGTSAVVWRTRPEVAAVLQTPDDFRGYEETSINTQIVELLSDGEQLREPVDELREGETGYAALAQTPFYLESGGQVSDTGWLSAPGGEAAVTGVVKGVGQRRFHKLRVTRGILRYRDLVRATVDAAARDATRRNHTATHLLHAALRQVLGAHVKQAGSLVAPDRLRFDFVHFAPLTAEELARIERLVTEKILENIPVQTEIRDTAEAIASGAMALFGEKYGDRVRVVTVPGFSIELCGGTHVRATGDIGAFFITEESGIAAGVRRIEALTGLGAYQYARERITQAESAARVLNAAPRDLVSAIETQSAALAKLKKEIQQLKTKLALGTSASDESGEQRVTIDGATLVTRQVGDMDKDALRTLADTLKSRLSSGIVVLASPTSDGKVAIVAAVTPDLTKRAPAGQLVKRLAPIVGGGGGGRPDFAEAGGKDPSKIGEMLQAARAAVEELLGRA
jgi:alanyl-tRNA synthetase